MTTTAGRGNAATTGSAGPAALNLRARTSRSQPPGRQVRDQIITAALAGVTNATSESLNRIAKLEAAWPTATATPKTSAAASASPAREEPDDDHPPQPAG